MTGVIPAAGQRIAVVGSGIAGLVSAWLLSQRHRVTLFESDNRLGGHTHTVDVEVASGRYAIDTGFIVFNERTYPNFCRLLQILGVEKLPTTMSFSMRCDRTGREWNGSSLNQLFSQRRNLLRPSFLGMLRDVLRFQRAAPAVLERGDDPSLAQVVADGRYGRAFVDHYLVPMGAAIWSAAPAGVLEMPAKFFLRFFLNHGMLQVRNRPRWYVVRGGSREYLRKLAHRIECRATIRCNTPVLAVRRLPGHVEITTENGLEQFDAVVLACHSDQALHLLADPTASERAVLAAIPYQPNEVVLHTDERLLPKCRRAWAAWNYRVPRSPQTAVSVTYCMNQLQSLSSPETFCVTLNQHEAIDERAVQRRLTYDHPVFTSAGVLAQQRWHEINGIARTWFCGAWWGNGFHEDGVNSALRVCAAFGLELEAMAGAA